MWELHNIDRLRTLPPLDWTTLWSGLRKEFVEEDENASHLCRFTHKDEFEKQPVLTWKTSTVNRYSQCAGEMRLVLRTDSIKIPVKQCQRDAYRYFNIELLIRPTVLVWF